MNPRSAAYEAAEDDRAPLPCLSGDGGTRTRTLPRDRRTRYPVAPRPRERLLIAPPADAGPPEGLERESRPRQARGNGHPAADGTILRTRTPTVVKDPASLERLRPAWRVALRRRGNWSIPSAVDGGLGSHPLTWLAQRDDAIESLKCRLGPDDWANAHTRGRPGAMERQVIARSG